jgi:hypothetical protein
VIAATVAVVLISARPKGAQASPKKQSARVEQGS